MGTPFLTGPVHLQDLNCSGDESRLEECNFNSRITGDCMNRSNTAGVECSLAGKFVDGKGGKQM